MTRSNESRPAAATVGSELAASAGRLKYAYKIVLVTVVLLLPLGFVSFG